MAADISDITQSNPEVTEQIAEILRISREMEATLARFRPLLDQLTTSPMATRRALRKAARSDRD